MFKYNAILLLAILLLPAAAEGQDLRIGILTDLSARMPQWGEQTAAGARLAQADLRAENINLQLSIEDHAMQPARAVSAIHKLLEADRAEAIYTEFSIPSSAIAPIVDQSRILTVFNAPLDSAIRSNSLAFRTFLDYRSMCRQIAEKWKASGINKISLIRIASESGDICIEGLKKVYNNFSVDLINSGEDLRPNLLRLNLAGSGGLINLALEPDVRNSLAAIRELHLKTRLGIPINMLSDSSREKFSDSLKLVDLYGFGPIDPAFVARLAPDSTNHEAAALSYTHLLQLARVILSCRDSSVRADCQAAQLSRAETGGPIGFLKWDSRVAQYNYQMSPAVPDK